MKRDHISEFESILLGRSCAVGRREADWTLDLSGGVRLTVSAPWRIVSNGRIAFSSEDDGQLFGLETPVDGEAEAKKILFGKVVTGATMDRETADLTLHFGEATRINLFHSSMGYEVWQAYYSVGDERRTLVATGGGKVEIIAE